jgi:ubiquinone/menaquinone biosynthesis C-methylase UbiE
MMISAETIEKLDGVFFYSNLQPTKEFEKNYIEVRSIEGRIYSDEEVKKLPFASSSNPHKYEWEMRAKSFLRFKEYLSKKKGELNIMDFGCGNGWFSIQLSKNFNHNFYCIDVNLIELEQGARINKSDKVKFFYANIFTSEILSLSFDLVIINSSIQYFRNCTDLITRLLSFLNSGGELHIIDSPIYHPGKVNAAKERTDKYYRELGFPQMSEFYYHHSTEKLEDFNYTYLYNPNSFKKKISKKIFSENSPFPWIKIIKPKVISDRSYSILEP